MENPKVVENILGAMNFAAQFDYPIKIEPEFSLKGAGSGIASNSVELHFLFAKAFNLSPTGRVQLTHMGS